MSKWICSKCPYSSPSKIEMVHHQMTEHGVKFSRIYVLKIYPTTPSTNDLKNKVLELLGDA